MLVYVKQMYR